MDYVDCLTALREDRDIGQKVIAQLLNCSQATISRLEKRKTNYSIDDLIILCKFYQVSADYVLGLPKGSDYPER